MNKKQKNSPFCHHSSRIIIHIKCIIYDYIFLMIYISYSLLYFSSRFLLLLRYIVPRSIETVKKKSKFFIAPLCLKMSNSSRKIKKFNYFFCVCMSDVWVRNYVVRYLENPRSDFQNYFFILIF